MSGEMKVSRWRLPLVIGALVVLAAAIAVGIGALIAHDQKVSPSPAAFASKSAVPSMGPSVLADPHGAKACELNEEARSADTLKEDAVLLRILREAQQSSNQSIRFDAQMLMDRQTLTNNEMARGGGDLEMVFGGQKASLEMSTDCIKAGLYSKTD